eukprot:5014984-Amphidinium_carterae.1
MARTQAPGVHVGASSQEAANPWDPEYQVIVVDECHLRSVQCDVIIAFTRWLQYVGVPVVLILMSATANKLDFKNKLNIEDELVIRIQGNSFLIARYFLSQKLPEILQRANGGEEPEMPAMKGALQAVVQILLNDRLWGEPPLSKTEDGERQ